MKISNATVKKFKKLNNLTSVNNLTSEQYRELMKLELSTSPKNNPEKLIRSISYNYSVRYINESELEVILKGKHLSRNVINTLPHRLKMVLKKKIHDAAFLFFLQNKKMLKPKWKRVKIEFEIHNPRSRDNDNNDLKAFRDTFVVNGLIADDNREVIPVKPSEVEVISKDYCVRARIVNIQGVCDA